MSTDFERDVAVTTSEDAGVAAGPLVRVNQRGYAVDGPKRATFITDVDTPVPWSLVDRDGNVVAEGATEPAGFDPSAGVRVHTLDASEYREPGRGLRLQVDGHLSLPFDVGTPPYRRLAQDALSFFYLQRSGCTIDAEVVGERYARPAGHVSRYGGGDINQGDQQVPCLPADESLAQYGDATLASYVTAWPGTYRLDVAGGWYDAGDLGKYVVNGGITVHQLLSAHERAVRRNDASPEAVPVALGDAVLRIPEAGNGRPDLLDEVGWELEFLRSMQVPEGHPLHGLAHHKVSDLRWVGLPMLPHEDPQPRYLHPPTTAATLNLAAVSAQGARVYAATDRSFADELLTTARRAYDAAIRWPALFAPPPTHPDPGSGPYDDDDVTDEFYWAAAELYLTTAEDRYLDDLVSSPHHTSAVERIFRREGFDWRHTAALGRLQLAVVPSGLPDRDRVIASVVAGAERFLQLQRGQPFGHPYAPTDGTYDWGSNHLLINNLVVMATAFDLTGDRRFLDGVLEGVDYLFGRNALGVSYVTGHGVVDVRNQHSRWFAHQLEPSTPNPPPGALAGGPNSATQDPIAAERVGGRPPQQCYVDHIESWSTNELTINWNAALGWLACFLAESIDPASPDGDGTP